MKRIIGGKMARINIDDSIFSDPRFLFACDEIGRFKAMGEFVFLVRTAQKYWLDGGGIPKESYSLFRFSEVFLTSGLVKENDDFYYLSGSEEHFSWLAAKKENGKKGGRPKKENLSNDNKSKGLEEKGENLEKATGFFEKANESYKNPLALSLSLAPSLALDNNNTVVPQAAAVSVQEDKAISKKDLFAEVRELWNSQDWKLKKLKAFSIPRVEKIKKQVSLRPELRHLEAWGEIFERMKASSFIQGDNDRNWIADFDWLLQKDSIDKLFDGKYDNRSKISAAEQKTLDSIKSAQNNTEEMRKAFFAKHDREMTYPDGSDLTIEEINWADENGLIDFNIEWNEKHYGGKEWKLTK